MNQATGYRVLSNLLKETSLYTGEEFINAAVRAFSRAFRAETVLISELIDNQNIRVISACTAGKVTRGWEMPIAGTPYSLFESLTTWPGDQVGESVIIPDEVNETFEALYPTPYRSYIGIPLWESDRKMSGHISLYFTNALVSESQRSFMVELCELFATKVQAELNRLILERSREQLMEELKQANARLMQDSITDSLTQMYNRRYYGQRMEEAFAKMRRNSETYGLLLVDLDFFKQINDTHGHVFGDEALQTIAKILRENTRSDVEIGFRIGGDEFAVLVQGDATGHVMETLGNRINQLVRETVLMSGSEEVRLSVSIGGACSSEQDATWDKLYERADAALYESKKAGRGVTRVIC